ncbi:MAG: hypothetical protein WCA96_13335, partial [Methylocella sp.]
MREHTSSKTHFEELACPDSIQTCPNSQILSDCFPVAGCRVKGKHVHARGWWRLRYRSQPNIAGNQLLSDTGLIWETITRPSKMTPTVKKTPTEMTQEACLTAPPPASADSDSGLTGAYLNQYTEMVKLIEQLPDTPEL